MGNVSTGVVERRTFERELRELGLGSGSALDRETPLPATQVDYLAAEPIFTESVRTAIGPVLSGADLKKAVAFNAANHPGVSEIPLADLRIRVANYIDQPALERTLGAALAEAQITAQLVNQFQQKCFRETSFHTGNVDEPTLDALGYVRHRGKKLNKVDSGVAAALASIKKAWKSDLVDLGADVTAKTWFSFVLDAPFLGLTAVREAGLHLELVRRLRKAQRHLMSLPAYKGLTPVELGDRLLWDAVDDPPPRPTAPAEPSAKFGDRHRGMRRPSTITTPMHPAGLAIDLAYRSNPYVGNATFASVTRNIARLVGGRAAAGAALGATELGKLGSSGRSTNDIYDEIAKWNGWMKRYFALGRSDVDLRAVLAARLADGTPGVLLPRETEAAQLRRWRTLITTDRGSLQSAGGFLRGRDPAKGFLSLHRDLVFALRDHGCLAWGGCDFGGGSGDIMHFDCRAQGIGRAYLEARGKSGPSAHPCLGVVPAAQIDMELKVAKLSSAIDGQLFELRSKKEGSTTAIFVPKAALGTDPVTLLVWIHGDLSCGDEGNDAPALVKGETFPFAKLVAESKKPVVLVAPSMRWKTNKDWHALGRPKAMNAFLDEIRSELVSGAGWAKAPAIGRVVLAGHSRGYVVLNALAAAHADAQWTKGGLAKVKDIWLVDTTYGKRHVQTHCDKWIGLLEDKPDIKVRLFFQETSDTSAVAECIRDAANAASPKLTSLVVQSVAHDKRAHCAMPRTQLPTLLETL